MRIFLSSFFNKLSILFYFLEFILKFVILVLFWVNLLFWVLCCASLLFWVLFWAMLLYWVLFWAVTFLVLFLVLFWDIGPAEYICFNQEQDPAGAENHWYGFFWFLDLPNSPARRKGWKYFQLYFINIFARSGYQEHKFGWLKVSWKE